MNVATDPSNPLPPQEDALLRSEAREARLRAIVEAMPSAIILVDSFGRIEMVNAQTEKLFGYSREQLMGKPMEMLVPERYRVHHPELRKSFFVAPHARPMGLGRDLYGLRRDSSEFPVEIGLNPIETEQGPMVLAAIVDLAARKGLEEHLRKVSNELRAENEQRRKAEEDLQRSRADFRYLFQRNPLPMWVYDQESLSFLEVNDAAINKYGYSHDQFLAMTILDIRPPDERERLKALLKISPGGKYDQSRNWRHHSKDGKSIEVDIFSHAMTFEGRRARLVVAVDVTARNAAEAQLRQSQKMEAIGQLTGGVAHDFNNLLTIILGSLEMISERVPTDAAINELIDDALSSVTRGANLTQRLLAYARQQPLEPRVVEMQQLVTGMTSLFRRSLGEAIEIQQVLLPNLWKCRVDPSQMENALLNLAVNARDAMPRGGRLTIEAQNARLDSDYVEGNWDVAPGDYVLVAVSDTGTGIAPGVLEHVLEPFFTTKPVGKGNGLGLSMIYGFVRQSGGHLKIYSELGKGTTVKIYFPRADRLDAEPISTVVQQDEAARGEVILLVEDEDNIRRLVSGLLLSLGYVPLEAPDGPTALQIIANTSHIDLLLTDVVLPGGMSGVEVATTAQTRHPSVKVLYMSGYTRNALIHNGVHDENVHLLSKPFRKQELSRAIQKLLKERSSS